MLTYFYVLIIGPISFISQVLQFNSVMPKSCVAYNCKNRFIKGSGITFVRFPFSRKHVLKKWILSLRREGYYPSEHDYICSEHFTPDCFYQNYINRRRLKEDAVPSIFDFPDPVRKLTSSIEVKKNTEEKTKKSEVTPEIPEENMFTVPVSSDVAESELPVESITVSQTVEKNGIFTKPIIEKITMNEAARRAPTIKVEASTDRDLVLGLYNQLKQSSLVPTEGGNNMSFVLVEQKPTVVSNANEEQLRKQLDVCKQRIASYKRQVKLLQQKNRRQNTKILELKKVIKDLNNNTRSTDEDVSEDDMSEGEIYEQLLKHQTQEIDESCEMDN